MKDSSESTPDMTLQADLEDIIRGFVKYRAEHGGIMISDLSILQDAPAFDMKAMRDKFRPVIDTSKRGRKARHKTVSKSADGRSLRKTGRTEHLNFKATPEIKAALAKHVPRGKISLWLEDAIIAKLRDEGVEIDAYIVERLRRQAEWYSDGLGPLCAEAADEIERLRGDLSVAKLQLDAKRATYGPKPAKKKNRL